MANYISSERWSLNNWLYYIKALPQNVSVIWIFPILVTVIASVKNKIYRRRCFPWLVWIFIFYLIFSYFDNKNSRFLALILIPIFALLIESIRILRESATFNQIKTKYLSITSLIFVFLSMNMIDYLHTPIKKISGIDKIVGALNLDQLDGNIAYVGNFRQPFVFYIRSQDTAREIHILQGEDILFGAESSIDSIAKKFRIELFIIEDQFNKKSDNLLKKLTQSSSISKLDTFSFINRKTEISLTIFQYAGPMNSIMSQTPLKSKLVQPH